MVVPSQLGDLAGASRAHVEATGEARGEATGEGMGTVVGAAGNPNDVMHVPYNANLFQVAARLARFGMQGMDEGDSDDEGRDLSDSDWAWRESVCQQARWAGDGVVYDIVERGVDVPACPPDPAR